MFGTGLRQRGGRRQEDLGKQNCSRNQARRGKAYTECMNRVEHGVAPHFSEDFGAGKTLTATHPEVPQLPGGKILHQFLRSKLRDDQRGRERDNLSRSRGNANEDRTSGVGPWTSGISAPLRKAQRLRSEV